MDFENKPECPIVKVDGFVSVGKQFDLDITLPEDDRGVIYGIVKDCFDDPVSDAVVKLVEIDRHYGKEERKPVSHTFTDKHGEFVFGPLCKDRNYAIEVWADKVKHYKMCAVGQRKGKCLKGEKLECPEKPHKPDCDEHYEDKCLDKHDCKDKYDCKDKHDYKDMDKK